MAFTSAWRNFKRMQDLTVAAAALIYAGAVIHAYTRLAGDIGMVVRSTLLWPVMYFAFALAIPLAVPLLKRWMARYVWMSFQAGFGQTAGSILTGSLLMLGAGVFIYRQADQASSTGQGGANVFVAYAAGIGILAAQAVLARALERLPEVKAKIEAPEGS